MVALGFGGALEPIFFHNFTSLRPSGHCFLLLTVLFFAHSPETFGSPSVVSRIDLKTAFSQALKNTQGKDLQESLAKQTEQRLSQATGRMLPQLALLGSYLHQAPSSSGNTGVSAFTRSDQYNARVNLTQPLFRGFGDFAERRSAEATWQAETARVQVAERLLYTAVAHAYYNVLAAKTDLDNLKAMSDLTEKRAVELKGRVKIGRSREGELIAAEAQVATLLAQIEIGKLKIENAREIFHFSTGLSPSTDLEEPAEELPQLFLNLDTILSLVEKRPDIVASRFDLTAAHERVTVARASHFPTVDFNANYYLTRTGILADSKWDLGVQITFPLFQGGETQARVNEANERQKQRELELNQNLRNAVREVRTLYQELSSLIAQHKALKKALSLQEGNYRVQSKDYRFGLATSLDVLQALNAFQETKRLLDRTRYEAMAAYASLRAATGTIE